MILWRHDTTRLDDYQRWELESYITAAYRECEYITAPILVSSPMLQPDGSSVGIRILCKDQHDSRDLFQALEDSPFEFLTLRDCEIDFNYSLIG